VDDAVWWPPPCLGHVGESDTVPHDRPDRATLSLAAHRGAQAPRWIVISNRCTMGGAGNGGAIRSSSRIRSSRRGSSATTSPQQLLGRQLIRAPLPRSVRWRVEQATLLPS